MTMDHTELCERLLALAESLVGDEWEHPLGSADTCCEAVRHLQGPKLPLLPGVFALDMDNPLADGLCLECLDKNVLIGTIQKQREEILGLRKQIGRIL
jgi:hypothetical protein